MTAQPAYVKGSEATPLLPDTIGDNLRRTVSRFPDRDALVCVEQNYRASYREFYDQTTRAARSLLASGVKPGDRLGIWSPNRSEWVVIQYATARIGVILVNINPAYRSNELAFVISQSGISFMVSALKFRKLDYKAMLEAVGPACEMLRETVYLDLNWDEFLERSRHIGDEELAAVEATVKNTDPVNIQYTSGTTGFPKGVTLTHKNILNNGYFIGIRLKYTEEDRVCIPVPFYHCFGMVIGNLCCTSHGACMVVPSESFDPARALHAVELEKCTSLYGVPTMFIAELQLPGFDGYDLRSLRTGVMAGSPCPIEIMKQVQSKMHMKEVTICYGMTETSPVSTQTVIGAPLEKQVSTVGTIHDHLEIKIIDPETHETCERNRPGELCTRGYSVMKGYWNNEAATHAVLDDEGWIHTGDIGVIDDDDYITISGRIKDLIIRGGENISPKEIEDFLYTHSKIEDVQVIGVPSQKYGEEVMAWVKVKKGEELTALELIEFSKEKIAHFKVPRFWKFTDSFPITISGKVRKVEMREISTAELGLDHEGRHSNK
ncbi:AMP-binding protein [Larkinella rosea]|uniref:AMP-binding protein n=1 Tax=Larkinella rosea TaxID=2025312 RepID=A0A3P1BPS9_9BACT|nr:AMP-binding protein [Larkinella rosea]RRB02544.1 AMP-binding protein [Larkinella rosea]